jgi:hypothetical protein
MNIIIRGLALTSVVMSIGCATAIARHDVFELSSIRLQRAAQSAQRTCQERQPKTARPSAADYEQCVVAEMRSAQFTPAKR